MLMTPRTLPDTQGRYQMLGSVPFLTQGNATGSLESQPRAIVLIESRGFSLLYSLCPSSNLPVSWLLFCSESTLETHISERPSRCQNKIMANNRYNQGVNQSLLGWALSEWCIFPEKQGTTFLWSPKANTR